MEELYDSLNLLCDGIISLQNELDSPGLPNQAPDLFQFLDEALVAYIAVLSKFLAIQPEELL